MKKKNHILCPVHGSIAFTNEEKKIIDSQPFQRLRGIKQLGLLEFVFPSATHTRFTHSLGVMHISDQILKSLLHKSTADATKQSRQYLLRIVRLAGLLHDIGHGPFSHLFESCYPKFKLNADNLGSYFKKTLEWLKISDLEDKILNHEFLSVSIIYKLSQDGVLSESIARDVCSFITKGVEHSKDLENALIGISHSIKNSSKNNSYNLKNVITNVVSGQLDADRIDYLLRDSYFTGVNISKLNLKHLLKSLDIEFMKEKDKFIYTISPSAVLQVEQALVSRAQMFNNVYLHRTSFVFQANLKILINKMSSKVWDGASLEEFLILDDNLLLEKLNTYYKDKTTKDSFDTELLESINKRKPLKRIKELHCELVEVPEKLTSTENELRLNPDVKNFLTYIISKKSLKDSVYYSDDKSDGQTESLFYVKNRQADTLTPLNNFSTIFKDLKLRKKDATIIFVEIDSDVSSEIKRLSDTTIDEIKYEIELIKKIS